jgi:hypothetical protein
VPAEVPEASIAVSAATYCSGVASQAPATNATHSDPPCIASPARVDSRENAVGVVGGNVATGASSSGIGAGARRRAGNRIAIIAASSSASTPMAI